MAAIAKRRRFLACALVLGFVAVGLWMPRRGEGQQQPQNRQPASGPDILKQEPTNTSEPRPMAGGKPLPDKGPVMQKQQEYLKQRYDLSGKTDPNVKMSGGRKNIPVGPTARLPQGVTWEQIGNMSPDEMKKRKAFPYAPLH